MFLYSTFKIENQNLISRKQYQLLFYLNNIILNKYGLTQIQKFFMFLS